MRYGSRSQIDKTFNQWDFIALIAVLGVIMAFIWSAQHMTSPFQVGDTLKINLDPSYLPEYSLRTVMRMFIAMGFSLLFTFILGTLAAKSRQAEKLIIPFIDIMQSVPILGFLAISVVPLIHLFPGSLLGPEAAAIFAIFTSQVWNMALSFYQSLRTIPHDIQDAAKIYHLGGWQKFWRIEVPFAIPSLLWNAMISMSAGWFFVVASEAITLANYNILLPGIGSYIFIAITEANLTAIGYAILAMLIVILLYDQIIFRPFISWSEKFRPGTTEQLEESYSWMLDILQRLTIFKKINMAWHKINKYIVYPKIPGFIKQKAKISATNKKRMHAALNIGWSVLMVAIIGLSMYLLATFILNAVDFDEIMHVFYLGFITAIKVTILIILSSLVWVPVGVALGMNPKVAQFCLPITQFIASFPMNLIYPLVVIGIIKYNLNVDVWTSPLMILGTQWYILFNVISGTAALPKDLILAAKNFGVKKWLWWKKLILPGIFPYYITGAMAAAGGCWNASIVADVVTWGDTTLQAVGLGGYITKYTNAGDLARIALGISVMCLYVTVINRLLWHKLQQMSEERFAIGN